MASSSYPEFSFSPAITEQISPAPLYADDGSSSAYPSGRYWSYVSSVDGWPGSGTIMGTRSGTLNTQYLMAENGTISWRRVWIEGSGWFIEQVLDTFYLSAKGSMITAAGDGLPSETVALTEGQVPTYHPLAANGITWESPTIGRRTFELLANPGLATATTQGYPGVYTLAATAANADDARAPWIRHTTGASNPSHSGVSPALYTWVRPGWLPDLEMHVATEGTITLMRIFAGLSSALPDGATIPNTLHGAYFKYETNAAVTTWQACTAAGGAPTVTTATGVTVAINSRYKLRIEFVGTLGSNPTSVRFYINDVVVATHVLTLPAANQTLSPLMRVSTLTTAARTFLWGKMIVAAG